MEFMVEYGLFFAKSVTVLLSLLVLIVVVFGASQRQRNSDTGHIEVKNLNDTLEEVTHSLKAVVLNPELLKKESREQKKKQKTKSKTQRKESKEGGDPRPRMFVVDFVGDVQASQVINLREEITAILSVAKERDEVLVRLESPGGVVHGYGLAASQLQRVRNKSILLTVSVDKVAASGGYMMACIGNKIIAAPFSLLGSIGVVAQIPNFHRLLKKNDIDVEILTAGEFKRTLTIFGENTEKGREKFVDDLEDVHSLFKEFVTDNRPQVDIENVSTGEAWFGKRALERKLVDELKTSDEYIIESCADRDVFLVKHVVHKNKIDKIFERVTRLWSGEVRSGQMMSQQALPKQFIQ